MAVVGTLTVDLVANTASFEGGMAKASTTAKRSSKEIQDAFNGMDFSEARGGMMLFDELIGVHMPRHATAFVSQIPGFAAAFSTMFPVVAILAAIVAIDKAVEASQKHREEIEKARQATIDSIDAMTKHTESMQLNNLKMQDQIALMEGRPARNKLQEALIEAKIAAGDLLKQLEKDTKEAAALLEKASVGSWKSAISGVDQNTAQTEEGKNKLKELAAAQKAYTDAIQKGESDPGKLQTLATNARNAAGEVDKLAKAWKDKTDAEVRDKSRTFLQKQANEEPTPEFAKAEEAKHAGERDAQRQLFAIAQQGLAQITALEQEQTDLRTKGKDEQVLADIQALDKVYAATKQVIAAQTKEVIAGYQVQLDQGQINAEKFAELKQDALDKEYTSELVHLEKVKALQAGLPELARQTDQKMDALNATHQAQVLTTYAATLAKQNDLNKALYAAIHADYDKDEAAFEHALSAKNKATIDFNKAYQAGSDKILLLTEEISDQEAIQTQHMDVATGHMTEQQAVQKALATLEKSKVDQLANINHELDAQLVKMNALAAVGGTQNNPAYNTAVLAYQTMEEKKLQITKQFNAQIDAERLKAANNERSQWNKMFLDWSNLQTNMSQFARQTLSGMTANLSKFIVTGQGDWRNFATTAIESLVQIELQHLIGFAVHETIEDKKKLSDAKSAARGAYSATSDIPIVGPFLAPIAAAAAFAGVMAFRQGGIVPSDAYAMVHQQEMVLPAHIANFVVNAANNSSGGSSGAVHQHHYIFAPNVQAIDKTGVREMLKTHHSEFKAHVEDTLRRMNQ